jgi:hypothetical protein
MGSSGGLIIAAAVTTGLAGTPASASAQASGLVTHKLTAAQQAATLAYWTPARMAAAKNMDLATIKGSPRSTSTGANNPAGAAGAAAGHTPSGAASSGTPSGPVPADGYTYPFPYTRFQVTPQSLWKSYPYETNGKVFFTNNGNNYVCSGTSVTVPDGREVWTAGHCVANTDGTHKFDSSFLFIPAYNGNKSTIAKIAPRGEWTGGSLVTTTAWLNNGDFSVDEGAAEMNNNASNLTLSQVVGNAGFAWNQNWIQDFSAFGYPQASPFNGKNMIQCDAGSAVQDTGIGGGGSPPIGIGCDMTGGSSGGAWEYSWGGGGPGYINGHNDYKYSSEPLAMYSPYQDTLSNVVRCAFYSPGSGDGC